MTRTSIIVGLVLLSIIAFIAYRMTLPPPGVDTKGPEAIIAWISLATATISLLTALVGLVMKLIELRDKRRIAPDR